MNNKAKIVFNAIVDILIGPSILFLIFSIVIYSSASSNKEGITAKCNEVFEETVSKWNNEYDEMIEAKRIQEAEAQKAAQQVQLPTATVTAGSLNVRSGPSKKYSIVTSVPKGTQVTILNYDNRDWPAIQLDNGMSGYVYSGYLNYN